MPNGVVANRYGGRLEHGSMRPDTFLESWSIANFKSISSASVSLKVGHFSVLTGTNSIGKSSLLQSLLMVCQSSGKRGDIMLNGPLTRLGIPEDIVRVGADRCEVGMEIRVPTDNETHVMFRCTVALRPTDSSKASSKSSSLVVSNVVFDSNGPLPLEIVDYEPTVNDQKLFLESMKGRYGDDVYARRVSPEVSELDRTYVVFKGMRPLTLVQVYDEETAYDHYRRLAEQYLSSGSSLLSYADTHRLERVVHRAALRSRRTGGHTFVGPMRIILEYESLTDEERNEVLDLYARTRSNNRPYDEWSIRDRSPNSLRQWGRNVGENDTSQTSSLLLWLASLLTGLDRALDEIGARVVYIGPLRDDPRVISPLMDVSNTNMPIGPKGEQTAAILFSKCDDEGFYGFPNEVTTRRSTMGKAVDAWARYLGIGGGVQSYSMQKLGTSISITTGESEGRDLTQVGVGASQAIPILVGVLQARQGSIVAIEQPELHLHPSAQAKLADFLLFARPDLTFIIESHSEALVTRLRRRAVEGENVARRISILFFEWDEEADGVVSRDLEIDAYGNLSAWPEGFMDAVQEDSAAIVQAALDKSRRMRGSHGRRR